MIKKKLDTSLLDKAIKFTVDAHAGIERKGKGFPYVIHPLEAVTIVATMTNDQELLAAAALHDVVEDTNITVEDIKREFGDKVAEIVANESENRSEGYNPQDSWHKRKETSMKHLAACSYETKLVALGDKLSNMRAIDKDYAMLGEELWQRFNSKDPKEHSWHYHTLASALKDLEGTAAYEEFKYLVNKVFPI